MSYVAYVIDRRLLPTVTREVWRGRHDALALDTLPALAGLRPDDIQEIVARRGPEVETQYALCPGRRVLIFTPSGQLENRRTDPRRPGVA